MIKGLLIDLGNTVWYNKNFDFDQGLISIYEEVIKPKVSLQEFLDFTKQFKKVSYDNREEFEISFVNYLNYLQTYFDFKFNKTLLELEYIFASNCENIELIEGIVDVLSFCKKNNIKIVCLSNSTFSSNTLFKQCQELKIDKYIDKLLSSSDNMFRKPNLNFFNLGIKALNLNNDEIVYIGNDIYFDIYGASRANLYSIWYNENKLKTVNNIDCLEVNNYKEVLYFFKTKIEG